MNHIFLSILLTIPWWGSTIMWFVGLALLLLCAKSLLGIVIIPQDKIGIVVKKFAIGPNSKLPEGRIIATKGEAGYQANPLPPGLHFMYWPWQYSINKISFTTVPQGQIGLVQAKDGRMTENGRILGQRVDCDNFQDVVKFLNNNGSKGRQSAYLSAGTYRINTAIFTVEYCNLLEIPENQVGIVTTYDGEPLPQGQIAGKMITADHKNFQDVDAFLEAKGHRGLQEQVLLSGRWNINPWFLGVKLVPMTVIDIGYVGVVTSFVGEEGTDVSGIEFTHGNIVNEGQKGVWNKTKDPGKYPLNTDIMKVTPVPTTNIVLNWATARTESHKLDEKLSTITVRSSDGFTFNLDVSQIINISNVNAPKVIARFGSIQNLVTQVLEPTIGNYFRNSAQKSDVIEFLKSRSDRQEDAAKHIKDVLQNYNVEAVDTLIGDITPPEALMRTLTEKKIAEKMKETYGTQREAEVQRKELESAKADADMQRSVVQSERQVVISEKTADSIVKKAQGDAEAVKIAAGAEAERITITADANAHKTTVEGKAQAEVTLSVGNAEAEVIQKKVDSMGEGYTLVQAVREVMQGGKSIVPTVLINGENGNGGGVINGMLGYNLLTGILKTKDLLGTGKEEVVPINEVDDKKDDKKK